MSIHSTDGEGEARQHPRDDEVTQAARQLVTERRSERERANTTSLYNEMRSRRSQGDGCFVGVKKSLGRCLRSSVCAVTICFFEAETLVARLRELPSLLKPGVTAFYWVEREPKGVWRGYPTASTVILLLTGLTPSRSVRSVLSLLIRDLPSGVRGGINYVAANSDHAPATTVNALRTEDEWRLWMDRHWCLLSSISERGEVSTESMAPSIQLGLRRKSEEIVSRAERPVMADITQGGTAINVKLG
jgi:hypothetical protein